MTSRISTDATYTCAVAATADETLAEEWRRRNTAGATAIAAGVLTLVGAMLVLVANQDFPTVALLEALRSRFGDAPSAGPGLLARKVLYYDDHAVQLVVVQLIPAIA